MESKIKKKREKFVLTKTKKVNKIDAMEKHTNARTHIHTHVTTRFLICEKRKKERVRVKEREKESIDCSKNIFLLYTRL